MVDFHSIVVIYIFIIMVVIKQWDYNNDDPFHQGISGNP
jgi:hypothetical protein